MMLTEIVTTPIEGVEITWCVPFDWTPPTTGTYDTPPEGGLELDGDPHPVCVTYYPIGMEEYTIDHIDKGSILGILLVEKYGTPSERECLEGIADGC